jgi:hypothetical protein
LRRDRARRDRPSRLRLRIRVSSHRRGGSPARLPWS